MNPTAEESPEETEAMSPETVQRPDSAVQLADLPAFVEALAFVRAELVAIPCDAARAHCA